jgi:MFS family permease
MVWVYRQKPEYSSHFCHNRPSSEAGFLHGYFHQVLLMLYSPSFIIMAFANLCTVSSLGTFFLFPLFLKGHGGTEADIGIIMGAFALATVIFRPWVSSMIDRIGRKRSYTIGTIINTILPLCYLLFDGQLSGFYIPVILARLAHGVGMAFCFTAVFTYVGDIIPKDRLNEGLGIFGITGLIGLAIGPVIGETIIDHFGFTVFFLIASGLAGLGLVSHLFLPESYVNGADDPPVSFFSVLVRPKILVIGLVALCFGFGLSSTNTFLAPYAQEKCLAFISLFYISYSTAAALTRLFGGKLADKVGEERIIPYAFVLTGTGLFSLVFLQGNVIFILAGFLSGCGHGLLFPSLNTLAIRDEPSHLRGKITGVFTGGIDTGAFVGAITLGFVGDWSGFRALFLIASLAPLTGLGIYGLFGSITRTKPFPD